jgi:hypothetical protein
MNKTLTKISTDVHALAARLERGESRSIIAKLLHQHADAVGKIGVEPDAPAPVPTDAPAAQTGDAPSDV